jgi:dihydrofolate reductase
MTKQKCIVFVAKSLDGFIAGENGELDWLNTVPNPEQNNMGYTELMQEIDAIVMGRNTFETVAGFGGEWPYAKPVFVLSRSLREIPEALQSKVSLLSGSPQDVIAQINAAGHQKLYIDGGRVVQDFLRADLIDELRITTIPILLGKGVSLFAELSVPLLFNHVKTEVFLGQIVQSCYRRRSK